MYQSAACRGSQSKLLLMQPKGDFRLNGLDTLPTFVLKSHSVPEQGLDKYAVRNLQSNLVICWQASLKHEGTDGGGGGGGVLPVSAEVECQCRTRSSY